jgi:hypothetical protein
MLLKERRQPRSWSMPERMNFQGGCPIEIHGHIDTVRG